MDFITEVLTLALVLFVGLAIRYIPHILHYFPGSSDMYFHFSKIRNPSHGEEELFYPSLFHWMFRVTRKPDGAIPERVLCFLMPIFDIFTATIIYLIIRGVFVAEFSLLVVLVFLVTPTVVIQGITFSPRPMGLLFLVSALLFMTFPFPLKLVAIVPIALTLLTHRLATQTLFFISLGASFIDWQMGIVFLGGAVFAILLSKGQYLKILQSHLSFIGRYVKTGGLPNRRIYGVILAPTIIGFLLYIIIHLLSVVLSFPLTLFGVTISTLLTIQPYFENLFLMWGVVGTFLLVFWPIGESYRYTYYASMPFAFFSAFILQSSQIFSLLLAAILLGCAALSIIFSVRFQHLDRDIVSLLRELKTIDECTYFLVPYHLLRAARYFSQKDGTYVAFAETTREQVSLRIKKKKVTHIVVDESHLDWFPNVILIKQNGNWFLLQVQIQC